MDDPCGQMLLGVHLCDEGWKDLPIRKGFRLPDESKLFNTIVKVGRRSFIVLDTYGNEEIPPRIFRRLFPGMNTQLHVVIDMKSGEIFTGVFQNTGPANTLYLDLARLRTRDFGDDEAYLVPAKFRAALPQLLSQKRPFNITCHAGALWSMIDRSHGFDHVREALIVQLQFSDVSVQIHGELYRTVQRWEGK